MQRQKHLLVLALAVPVIHDTICWQSFLICILHTKVIEILSEVGPFSCRRRYKLLAFILV